MAYTNFINCTKEEYEEQIYSGDSRHRLRIWFNEVELEDADVYCEKLTVKPRIIPNGSKVFGLDNFVSTEATLIIHDLDLSTVVNPVRISIGTLVGDTYEDVPIGTFIIQDKPTTDKGKTTIKLLDNANAFDFNYDGRELIEANGGSATKLQIFQDICSKAGIETSVTTFLKENDLIGTYDNTIKARTYISYLAEQSGAIAKVNRDGVLTFVYLNDLQTQRIPLSLVEKYTDGDKYKISRVVYEDGVRKFDKGDETADTLYLNMANPYINSEEQVEEILGLVNGFEINSFTTGKIIGNPTIDPYDIIEIYDDYEENEPVIARTLATYTLTYNGVITNTYDTQIGLEERKENTTITTSPETIKRFVQSSIDEVNATITLISGQIDENGEQISEIQNSMDGVSINVTNIENNVESLSNELSITASGLNARINKSGNNLLYGTALYDLSQWGWQPTGAYIESNTPPSFDEPYNWWYCTQDNDEYVNGSMYIKLLDENDVYYWGRTDYTKKEIQEGYQTNIITIIEDEWTKNNFLSQKALDFSRIWFEETEHYGNGYTTIKPTQIDKTMNNLVFSFKVKNNLRYGIFNFAIEEINSYTITNETLNNSTYGIQHYIHRGEYEELSKFEISIPIITNKDIVTGYIGNEEPNEYYMYWFDTTTNNLKRKNEEDEWELIFDKVFKDNTNDTYYRPVFINNNSLGGFYIEANTYSDFDTKSIYGILSLEPIRFGFSDIDVISENEPTPIKGMYWAKPSMNAIYYANYDLNNNFDSWELLPYTYSTAVENSEEYLGVEYPTIPIDGNIIIGDIKLEYGTSATDWGLNQNESYGKNYKLDDKGFEVSKGDYKMFIDEDEVSGYYKETLAFQLNEYNTYSKRGIFEETDQNGLITKKLSNGKYVRYIK